MCLQEQLVRCRLQLTYIHSVNKVKLSPPIQHCITKYGLQQHSHFARETKEKGENKIANGETAAPSHLIV